ncbi:MAG: LacI family DNA-binding transcriptional regulator [Victivallaceae bacterium]
MNFTKAHTKSFRVAEAIAENIRKGVLKPGDRIQTVRALADEFAVSLSVIQAAMRELEAKKLIERKDNSIALVSDNSNPFSNAGKQVMLCLQNTGHIFAEVAGLINCGLIARGFLTISMDYNKMDQPEPDEKFKQNINMLLGSGLKSVILSGHYYWHYPFMEEHPATRAVFLYEFDYAGPMPERAVLFDLEAAIYQTTAHLASLGRKKIMLCTFKTEPRAISLETVNRHHSTQIRNGYERALREYDIASYNRVFIRGNPEIDKQKLSEIMKERQAPDAIVCDSDYTAMQVEMLALKNGLKVPDDLAIAGVFNTPWSELSPVPLTTATYDWNQLAEHAIELALESKPEQKIYYMKPTLVVKNSSGDKENEKAE